MKIDLSLYLITDRELAGERSIEDVVAAAIRGGVTCVQLREKNRPGKEFLDVTQSVKHVVKSARIPYIVNDRVDIALISGADGVHIGQDDLPLVSVRELLGSDRIIGVSAQTPEEGKKAEAEGADYIGAGPVFATGTKTDAGKPISLDGLYRVVEAVSIPVVAIGGINGGNVRDVIRCGAAGAAVISAIIAADDPESAAREIADAIREVRQ